MTTQEREQLQGIIQGWRTEAADTRNEDMAYARGLEDCADSLEEALTGMGDGWIPVEERLPEGRGAVLFYSPWCGVNIGHWTGGAWRDRVGTVADVTHWQPLPEGPKR